MSDFYSLTKDFGFPVALAVFFALTNWLREKQMTSAMDQIWQWHRTTLVELIKENQATNLGVTHALQETHTATQRLLVLLESRPCVADSPTSPPNGRRL